jgi:hypothetical protein
MINTLSQGARATISGKELENLVEDILIEQEVDYKSQKPFEGVYMKTCKMDFYINGPTRIAIECKAQKVAGSVDEKIPYVMLNLAKIEADMGILVMEGAHFENKPHIKTWAKSYCHDHNQKVLKVMSLNEFEEWLFEQTEKGSAA